MSRIAERAAAILGSENIHLNSRVDRIAYTEDGGVWNFWLETPMLTSLLPPHLTLWLWQHRQQLCIASWTGQHGRYIEAFDVLWMNEFCGG
ncbi:hypothetical protein MY11210_001570 [Beauveria gryllotalpidicola]